MSGPFDYPVRNNKASVPLVFLDPGIALLVKVLPLFGIRTLYSCNGHLRENPFLCFESYEDLDEMTQVLNNLLPREVVQEKFIFKRSYGWMDIRLELVTIQDHPESHYEAYMLATQIGKKLLNYFKTLSTPSPK